MSRGRKDSGQDFFISYTRADQAWAEWVAWELEAVSYLTVLQAWDFAVGTHFIDAMHAAAQSAKRTIVILSNAYLDSASAEAEWQEAWRQDPMPRALDV
jgi:TIR domain